MLAQHKYLHPHLQLSNALSQVSKTCCATLHNEMVRDTFNIFISAISCGHWIRRWHALGGCGRWVITIVSS